MMDAKTEQPPSTIKGPYAFLLRDAKTGEYLCFRHPKDQPDTSSPIFCTSKRFTLKEARAHALDGRMAG